MQKQLREEAKMQLQAEKKAKSEAARNNTKMMTGASKLISAVGTLPEQAEQSLKMTADLQLPGELRNSIEAAAKTAKQWVKVAKNRVTQGGKNIASGSTAMLDSPPWTEDEAKHTLKKLKEYLIVVCIFEVCLELL